MKPGVRVSGGTFRGRGLPVPPGARPTEGMGREALFSIWGERIRDARLLDLFAGSGVLSLEAAGRGASSVLAVDGDSRTVKSLETHVASLSPKIALRRLQLPEGLARLVRANAGPFDLVFADPPYNFSEYEGLLAGLIPLLAPEAEIVVEHSARQPLPAEVSGAAGGLVRSEVRRYGESSLAFYRLG